MNLKKLFLTGVVALLVSPLALADEIGSGYPLTTTNATTMAGDEIGSGTPTASASDEIGSGATVEAMLAWWSYMLQAF
ncbi:MAG TPA: hypothetical protein VF254_00980 [Gammaproteobacteria bacterium]